MARRIFFAGILWNSWACSSMIRKENFGNNIDVDPTFKCHAERSRSIYLKRGLRSFTLVQDDKVTKKMSCGSTAILLLEFFCYLIEH